MNKRNKQLNYIKLGLLAFAITLSPLTLACYSGCSPSSNQPSTGRGVVNLTRQERTAKSYTVDNNFRKSSHIDKVLYVYDSILGYSYKDTEAGVYVSNFGAFLLSSDHILMKTKKILEGMIEDGAGGRAAVNELKLINQELKNRADARAKADGKATNDENSINSVIGELQPYDITGAYLGSDPKRARDKAKQLSADADKKREEAKKARRKGDSFAKGSLSISDENKREIAKTAANRAHDRATQLENEANDLERSADDHKKSADRWEKRAAKKQKAAPKNNKATVIQKADASSAGIPNR